jgi:hypothetical protein
LNGPLIGRVTALVARGTMRSLRRGLSRLLQAVANQNTLQLSSNRVLHLINF